MHFLHIDSIKDVHKIDKAIKQGKDVFVLVYMLDCGPCEATRPEWEKMESALNMMHSANDQVYVIDVNQEFLPNIKHLGPIEGFPSMQYVGNKGNTREMYDNSPVHVKDRSVSSFMSWVEGKLNTIVVNDSSPVHKKNKKKKKKKGTTTKRRPRPHSRLQKNKHNPKQKQKQTRRVP